MDILSIINKKKQKQELNQKEIDYVVNEYVINKSIPDYQVSALLMAWSLNGMSDKEIYYLTKAFVDTSVTYQFSTNQKQIMIDKHSLGGVGDKVTLIITPILKALGYSIAKISGRGLGHTGGTIDKLDSINFNSNLTYKQAQSIFKKNGLVLLQQTKELLPADKMFYALRDVTCTVNTPGLIIASVLSKKFAINSKYIFIDLKVGSGASCKTINEANTLAKKMLKVAKLFKRKIFISITDMNQPLGNAVGNLIEIKEAIDFLLNKNVNSNLSELVQEFIVEILLTTKKITTKSQAIKKYHEVINNKSAYNAFIDWLKSQNANIKLIQQTNFYKPKYHIDIKAKQSGYINFKSTEAIGLVAVKLGAGRKKKEDKIDNLAGIYLHHGYNEFVNKNDKIATLYSSSPISNDIVSEFSRLIYFNKSKHKNGKMVLSVLRG